MIERSQVANTNLFIALFKGSFRTLINVATNLLAHVSPTWQFVLVVFFNVKNGNKNCKNCDYITIINHGKLGAIMSSFKPELQLDKL